MVLNLKKFFWIAWVVCVGASSLNSARAEKVDFNRDVRPILSDKCFLCHGTDKRKGKLRLDLAGAAVERGAIVPGKPDESELVKRIFSTDPDEQMPPPDSNRTLTEAQKNLLKEWIAEGAKYEKHWAFIPPVKRALPAVKEKGWAKNEIDRFILARLEIEGLRPTSEAPIGKLLRRVALDLTGLPPEPEQIKRWLGAKKPYETAVDELLASEHFGERMASDWMDVARYADTHGFNNDSARSMWRWRDWVIGAFNKNMPYDQFIKEQLAGDLLEKPTLDQRIATAFNRNHVINSEGGIIEEEYRVEYVADRVQTTSLAWLGLTVQCARCHDHKFDPVTQKDYYKFFAFFNNVDESGEDGRIANASPIMPAPTSAQQAEMERARKKLRAAEQKIGKMLKGVAWKTVAPPETLSFVTNGAKVSLPKIDGNKGWSMSFWIRRTNGVEASIFSTANYKVDPSSQEYGRGVDLRVTEDGRIDLRVANRWPGYSAQVVTREKVPAEGWHRVSIGGDGGSAAKALRIFIDCEEAFVDTEHNDCNATIAPSGQAMVGAALAGEIANLVVLTNKLDVAAEQALLARSPGNNPELAKAFQERASARAALQKIEREAPTVMVMRELTKPRETHVLFRGQYDSPKDKVEAGTPEFLLPLPKGAPANRLGLAKWLTDPKQPLTARVVVNRFWASFFGDGIVKSVEDLGFQADYPSHPELLDWLAVDFVENGWDVKKLVRKIVMSATYRQDSKSTEALNERDPENRLHARGARQRLSAEMVRDQALALSGLLQNRIGGPSVYPYQPANLYKGIVVAADYPGTKWENSKGADLYRRSLYTFWKRTVPNPTLATFDAPDREVCVARRLRTNTPLQALALMNDTIQLEAARKFAERMLREGGDDPVGWAFEMATARKLDAPERAELKKFLDSRVAAYKNDSAAAEKFLAEGASERDKKFDTAELAAYANMASLILNLDETVTRN